MLPLGSPSQDYGKTFTVSSLPSKLLNSILATLALLNKGMETTYSVLVSQILGYLVSMCISLNQHDEV